MGEGATLDRVLGLLTVAYHTQVDGNMDQNALAKALDMSVNVASRNVAALSDVGDRGGEPLRLVDVRFDPSDRRRRLLSANSRGLSLVNKAMARLNGRK